jgi:hypothetical protein
MAMIAQKRINQHCQMLRWSFRLRRFMALVAICFFVIFAPLICIIHCQILVHSIPNGHHRGISIVAIPHIIALASFVAPPAATHFLCDLALTVPSDTPTLPPESTLPPVLHDLLPTLPQIFIIALLTQAIVMMCSSLLPIPSLAPSLPPPKAILRFA